MMTSNPVKAGLQRVLNSVGLLERARASTLYDAYWRVADPAVLDRRAAEVTFYRNVLQDLTPGAIVFDIGANQGAKTDIFLRLGARVVAVEPDPFNHRILEQKFRSYRWRQLPVSIVPDAVAAEEGSQTLWIDEPGSGKNTLKRKWVDVLQQDSTRFGHNLQFGGQHTVTTTTADRLMTRFGEPFFIKIDVEGAELDVISGLKKPVPYLSFEINLPEFLEEGCACVTKLRGLTERSRFNYLSGNELSLAMPEWLPAADFVAILRSCSQPSIEVFCRTV
jgi:FkbM family methyltransferase